MSEEMIVLLIVIATLCIAGAIFEVRFVLRRKSNRLDGIDGDLDPKK